MGFTLSLKTLTSILVSIIVILVGGTCLGVTLFTAVGSIKLVGENWARGITHSVTSHVFNFFTEWENSLVSGALLNLELNLTHPAQDMLDPNKKNWTDVWGSFMLATSAKHQFAFSNLALMYADGFWMTTSPTLFRNSSLPVTSSADLATRHVLEWIENLDNSRTKRTVGGFSFDSQTFVKVPYTEGSNFTHEIFFTNTPLNFAVDPYVLNNHRRILAENPTHASSCQWSPVYHTWYQTKSLAWETYLTCAVYYMDPFAPPPPPPSNSLSGAFYLTNRIFTGFTAAGFNVDLDFHKLLADAPGQSPHSESFLVTTEGFIIATTRPESYWTSRVDNRTNPTAPRGCSLTTYIVPDLKPPRIGCLKSIATYPYVPLNAVPFAVATTPTLRFTFIDGVSDPASKSSTFAVSSKRLKTKLGFLAFNVIVILPDEDLGLNQIQASVGLAAGLCVIVVIAAMCSTFVILNFVTRRLELIQQKMIDVANLKNLDEEQGFWEDNDENNINKQGAGSTAVGEEESFGLLDDNINSNVHRNNNNNNKKKPKGVYHADRSWISEVANLEDAYDETVRSITNFTRYVSRAVVSELILQRRMEMLRLKREGERNSKFAGENNDDEDDEGHACDDNENKNINNNNTSNSTHHAETAQKNRSNENNDEHDSANTTDKSHQQQHEKRLESNFMKHYEKQSSGTKLNLDHLSPSTGSVSRLLQEYDVTVMSAEIEGFSTIWSSNPENHDAVCHILHIYFKRMCRLIMGHGGVVDKFLGDSIMSYWGAPVRTEHHALLATLAALSLVRESRRDPLKKIFDTMVKRPLRLRCGLSSGRALVGTVGTRDESVLNYSIMGVAVTMSRLLQMFNKSWKTSILMDGPCMRRIGETVTHRLLCSAAFREEDATKPEHVYEVCGLNVESQMVYERVILAMNRGVAAVAAVSKNENNDTNSGKRKNNNNNNNNNISSGEINHQKSTSHENNDQTDDSFFIAMNNNNNGKNNNLGNHVKENNSFKNSYSNSAAVAAISDYKTIAFSEVLSMHTLQSNEGIQDVLHATTGNENSNLKNNVHLDDDDENQRSRRRREYNEQNKKNLIDFNNINREMAHVADTNLNNLLRWHATRTVISPGHTFFADKFSEAARASIDCKFGEAVRILEEIMKPPQKNHDSPPKSKNTNSNSNNLNPFDSTALSTTSHLPQNTNIGLNGNKNSGNDHDDRSSINNNSVSQNSLIPTLSIPDELRNDRSVQVLYEISKLYLAKPPSLASLSSEGTFFIRVYKFEAFFGGPPVGNNSNNNTNGQRNPLQKSAVSASPPQLFSSTAAAAAATKNSENNMNSSKNYHKTNAAKFSLNTGDDQSNDNITTATSDATGKSYTEVKNHSNANNDPEQLLRTSNNKKKGKREKQKRTSTQNKKSKRSDDDGDDDDNSSQNSNNSNGDSSSNFNSPKKSSSTLSESSSSKSQKKQSRSRRKNNNNNKIENNSTSTKKQPGNGIKDLPTAVGAVSVGNAETHRHEEHFPHFVDK